MAFQNKNYFQRRTKPRGPRTNDRIRAQEVPRLRPKKVTREKPTVLSISLRSREAKRRAGTIQRGGVLRRERRALVDEKREGNQGEMF